MPHFQHIRGFFIPFREMMFHLWCQTTLRIDTSQTISTHINQHVDKSHLSVDRLNIRNDIQLISLMATIFPPLESITTHIGNKTYPWRRWMAKTTLRLYMNSTENIFSTKPHRVWTTGKAVDQRNNITHSLMPALLGQLPWWALVAIYRKRSSCCCCCCHFD